tara:strand:+ start:199 stop:402 length:204 start_codon:yes stop_codon:yes gene_type:complete
MLLTNLGDTRKCRAASRWLLPYFYKPNNTRTQLDRMRLAHGGSPSMGKVNHRSRRLGILNFKDCNML